MYVLYVSPSMMSIFFFFSLAKLENKYLSPSTTFSTDPGTRMQNKMCVGVFRCPQVHRGTASWWWKRSW